MRFTDDELLTLSEMLTLACWTTFWNHQPGADSGVARYDDLLNKVLKRLQDNGQGREVELDPERQRLRLCKEKEEGSFYAQSFDVMRNEIFWEELVGRLAERELDRKHGTGYVQSLPEQKRKQVLEPVSKRFWDEFSTRGIANLHVVSSMLEG
ncbi:hypothetical protein HW115_03770 [Verrucomicrobiaceae bacterium N1E253]|uniref:Uncharacterized protein n=1 Tax=Oceaniferula marina TaxID=2748318 RepID=A0A851GKL7_9BACT|nr:hypothetical protein [Oceaniferula marina]NWK54714.1 hypothetical protein [Oceaniferula marina]